MTWFYFGREISGAQEIRNLKTLKNNPKERAKYINLGKAINIGTVVILGTFILGVVILTIWGLSWVFQDGFNLWAILFNPVWIVFSIIFLGISAGRPR
jgi:hypothetical protein